jgi:hypothetical protein
MGVFLGETERPIGMTQIAASRHRLQRLLPMDDPAGLRSRGGDRRYESIFIDRSRKALATTDTELRLMAAAAIIGLSSRWLESG